MVKKKIEMKGVVLGEAVERYLESKSPATAGSYRTCLKRFKAFYGKDLGEFLKEVDRQRKENDSLPAPERRRFFEVTINDFITFMKDHDYANNPIRGSLTALQNFFLYYDVPISFKFVKMPSPISKKKNHKHKWKLEQIKEFVDRSPSYREKALIMVMFQSGMAVNEICNLNYGDVAQELESGELPLLIDVVREKNANPFKTLIGADAVKYLKLYLGARSNLRLSSPLFTKSGSKERITEAAIQGRFRELAIKVFGVEEGEMNPYRPHSMRSAFRSRLTGKTDGDLIKFWMGDKLGPKAGAYLNLDDEEHKELYIAVEGRLSIETTSKDVLKGRPSEGEQAHLIKAYQERLADLEMKNESLERMISSIAEHMGRLEAFVESLGYEYPKGDEGEVRYNEDKNERRQ